MAEADTLLLTLPDQLGVDYNAHLTESILTHVGPPMGWRTMPTARRWPEEIRRLEAAYEGGCPHCCSRSPRPAAQFVDAVANGRPYVAQDLRMAFANPHPGPSTPLFRTRSGSVTTE
jgi:hypothetical protein